MIKLNIPLKEEEIRKLKIGDNVLLDGVIFTARDMAHKFFVENKDNEFKKLLDNGVIYHCGPIARKNNEWKIVAAGPTTSIREEPYMAEIIKEYGIKAIIGKGGMAKKTLDACKKYGCVYLAAIGGAAILLAKNIKRVVNVYHLEFGLPEAIWELEVEDFPAIVAMDANGNSLYDNVMEESKKIYTGLIK